jgi:uncharacterized protein YwgA
MTTISIDNEEEIVLVLLWVDNFASVSSLTKVQKLVFLAQNGGLQEDAINPLSESYFSFEQEKYGPYSVSITDCLERLEQDNLINKTVTQQADREEYSYTLTSTGEEAIDSHIMDLTKQETKTLIAVKKKYNNMPTAQLLDKIYDEYPSYSGTR